MDRDDEQADVGPGKGTMIRDAFVVQVKLVVDGLRDFVLVPVAFIAAIVSLVSGRDGRAGPQFYEVLALGKRSEQWIDLFGALRNAPPGVAEASAEDAPAEDRTMDDVVRRVESYLVEEYQRGDVSRQAKERIDEALAALQKRRQ